MNKIRQIVSLADLTYQGAARLPEHGLPLGNGRMGSLIWLTPNAIHLQINRCDVFGMNSSSRSVGITDSDFSCGCAFADIEFGSMQHPVFDENTVSRLSVYEGEITISGNGVLVRCRADMNEDAFLFSIDDNRQEKETISIHLRALRYQSQYVVGRRNYTHPSLKPGGTVSYRRQVHQLAETILSEEPQKISLRQNFTEGSFFCGSLTEAGTTDSCCTYSRNQTESVLEFSPFRDSLTFILASAASFEPKEPKSTSLSALLSQSFTGLWKDSCDWWHSFWDRAPLIVLESQDGYGQKITEELLYFTYLMACTSRGSFMPRYGGLLFQTDGDFKMWGSQYWWHNNSCYYAAILSAGMTELCDPLVDTIFFGKKAYEKAAVQQWGSEGMWIPETFWFNGPEELPEELQLEFQQLYREEKLWEERSSEFMKFSEGRNTFDPRFGWIAHRGEYRSERGFGPFGYVNHIFSSGAKIAYWLWVRYELTMDESYLKDKAYPILKNIADFYTHLPLIQKAEDGKLHIYHCNNHESIWGGTDTVSELTAIHGILPIAIRAAKLLDTDQKKQTEWIQFLNDITPIPTSSSPDALLTGLEEGECWVNGRKPYHFGHMDTTHLCEPLFLYDYCTPETTDKRTRQLGENTLREIIRSKTDENGQVVLDTLDLAEEVVARSCNPDAFEAFIKAMYDNTSAEQEFCDLTGIGYMIHLDNRMALREGPQSIGAQKQGHLMSSVSNALCHAFAPAPGEDPVLYLFSALPNSWNASIRMNTVKCYTVEASSKDGSISQFRLTAHKKSVPLQIHNPWHTPVKITYSDHTETAVGKTFTVVGSCTLEPLSEK